ncbi:hypothetical protein BGW80DRAFT_1301639 [Lactifluus volemus]|nr:hypothetical protein BGW80DRAFT_1301639 [Lactifluus volemus]
MTRVRAFPTSPSFPVETQICTQEERCYKKSSLWLSQPDPVRKYNKGLSTWLHENDANKCNSTTGESRSNDPQKRDILLYQNISHLSSNTGSANVFRYWVGHNPVLRYELNYMWVMRPCNLSARPRSTFRVFLLSSSLSLAHNESETSFEGVFSVPTMSWGLVVPLIACGSDRAKQVEWPSPTS